MQLQNVQKKNIGARNFCLKKIEKKLLAILDNSKNTRKEYKKPPLGPGNTVC
jgi:hypothetical protein